MIERMTISESPISDRELEILRLAASGATNQQIASQLNISINTVKVHMRKIFGKIGVESRTEATIYAIRHGYVQVGDAPRPADASEAPPASAPAVVPASAAGVPEAALGELAVGELAARQPPTDTMPLHAPSAAPPAAPLIAPRRRGRAIAIVAALIAVALGAAVALQLLRPALSAPNVTGGIGEAARWRELGAAPQSAPDLALATDDGRLFIFGSDGRADRYEPAGARWSPLPPKPTPVSGALAATVGRVIYLPGGVDAAGKTLAAVETFDPRAQTWQAAAALPQPRRDYALAALEGRLYLFGGSDGTTIQRDVFRYDPETRTWAAIDSLPRARAHAAAAAIDGRIYLVGGEDARGLLATVERFDPTGPEGGRWETLPSLPQPVARPAALAAVTTLLVLDPATRRVAQYTPGGDAWSAADAPAGIAFSEHAALLGTSVVTIESGRVAEYRAIYNTFLPGTSSGN